MNLFSNQAISCTSDLAGNQPQIGCYFCRLWLPVRLFSSHPHFQHQMITQHVVKTVELESGNMGKFSLDRQKMFFKTPFKLCFTSLVRPKMFFIRKSRASFEQGSIINQGSSKTKIFRVQGVRSMNSCTWHWILKPLLWAWLVLTVSQQLSLTQFNLG